MTLFSAYSSEWRGHGETRWRAVTVCCQLLACDGMNGEGKDGWTGAYLVRTGRVRALCGVAGSCVSDHRVGDGDGGGVGVLHSYSQSPGHHPRRTCSQTCSQTQTQMRPRAHYARLSQTRRAGGRQRGPTRRAARVRPGSP